MIWNPLNAQSPLRSKRVQGALLVLLALVGEAAGVSVPDELIGAGLEKGNVILAELGTLWGLIGTITAKASPRPF